MAKTRKDYYVFEGQKASTGTPNKITGRMSFYGTVEKFESKKEAIAFSERRATLQNPELCIVGTKRKMRKYCLGISIYDFDEYINNLGCLTFNPDIGYWE